MRGVSSIDRVLRRNGVVNKSIGRTLNQLGIVSSSIRIWNVLEIAKRMRGQSSKLPSVRWIDCPGEPSIGTRVYQYEYSGQFCAKADDSEGPSFQLCRIWHHLRWVLVVLSWRRRGWFTGRCRRCMGGCVMWRATRSVHRYHSLDYPQHCGEAGVHVLLLLGCGPRDPTSASQNGHCLEKHHGANQPPDVGVLLTLMSKVYSIIYSDQSTG